jgi:hypothetical protein
MKNWIEQISKIDQIDFYLLSNMTPCIDGVDMNILPNDMTNVLKRARQKGELSLGDSLTGAEAAKLLSSLYEKYNDEAHSQKRAIVDAKDKQDEINRRINQDEYK